MSIRLVVFYRCFALRLHIQHRNFVTGSQPFRIPGYRWPYWGLLFLLNGGVSQTDGNDQLVFFRAPTARHRSIAIVDRWLSFGSAISRQQKFTVIASDSAFIGIAAFLLYCTLYYTKL
jgi:hypothetical protein